MGWWDTDVEDEAATVMSVPESRAEIVRKVDPVSTSLTEEKFAEIRAIEDEILAESSLVIRDALRFREIEPDADGPPEVWVDEVGEEEAMRRFRMAKAAHMNAKQAPVGFSLAKATMVGITKARAAAGAGVRTLNVGVSVVMPAPEMKIIEVDND